jgi:hypothetical protein
MIVEIFDSASNGRVKCTLCGREITAGWISDTPPTKGRVSVEIDIPGEFNWGPEVSLTPESDETCIEMHGDHVSITGRVIDFDELNVLTIVTAGSPVMIDTIGEPPLGIVGRKVLVRAPKIDFYPTGVYP